MCYAPARPSGSHLHILAELEHCWQPLWILASWLRWVRCISADMSGKLTRKQIPVKNRTTAVDRFAWLLLQLAYIKKHDSSS